METPGPGPAAEGTEGKGALVTSGTSVEELPLPPVVGISKIQALFRGNRCREVHTRRAREGNLIICPYVASSPSVIRGMMDLSSVASSDVVFDLGCGDGSILIAYAQEFPTIGRLVGYEIDEVLVRTARSRIAASGLGDRITIKNQDLITIDDLSDATVVVMFLVPSCLRVLSPILRDQLTAGSRIVCYKYPLPTDAGWAPFKIIETDDVVNIKSKISTSCVYGYHIA
jgi:SAM-dependent methyltransferase